MRQSSEGKAAGEVMGSRLSFTITNTFVWKQTDKSSDLSVLPLRAYHVLTKTLFSKDEQVPGTTSLNSATVFTEKVHKLYILQIPFLCSKYIT